MFWNDFYSTVEIHLSSAVTYLMCPVGASPSARALAIKQNTSGSIPKDAHRCSLHQSCVLAYGMREAVCVYVCAARPPTHPHGIPPTSGLPPIAAQSAFARRVHTGRLDVDGSALSVPRDCVVWGCLSAQLRRRTRALRGNVRGKGKSCLNLFHYLFICSSSNTGSLFVCVCSEEKIRKKEKSFCCVIAVEC